MRSPPDEEWTWARGFMEAVNLLMDPRDPVTVLALDHDLGKYEPTGYDLIRWIAHHRPDLWPERISVHTANPVGRENIVQTIVASKLYSIAINGDYVKDGV